MARKQRATIHCFHCNKHIAVALYQPALPQIYRSRDRQNHPQHRIEMGRYSFSQGGNNKLLPNNPANIAIHNIAKDVRHRGGDIFLDSKSA